MNFHAKSEVCNSKNDLVMSTLYFCTFLYSYFVRTVHTNFYAKSGVSSFKNERVMFNLVISAVLLLLRPPVSFVFEGFQIGSPSSSPDISGSRCPTKIFHPSKCCCWPRIASAALIVVHSRFILFVSHQTSLKYIQVTSTEPHTHRHLDM